MLDSSVHSFEEDDTLVKSKKNIKDQMFACMIMMK